MGYGENPDLHNIHECQFQHTWFLHRKLWLCCSCCAGKNIETYFHSIFLLAYLVGAKSRLEFFIGLGNLLLHNLELNLVQDLDWVNQIFQKSLEYFFRLEKSTYLNTNERACLCKCVTLN